MTPQTAGIIVPISLEDLASLADVVATLDGLKGYCLTPDLAVAQDLIDRGHDIIERAAGEHVGEIYADDDGSTPWDTLACPIGEVMGEPGKDEKAVSPA